jgi:peptidoglycan/xylan/chitin deacetylase (PgdA/CDA1 family)
VRWVKRAVDDPRHGLRDARRQARSPQNQARRYERKLELAAIHRAATAGNYLVRGQARRKLVALTFDDGPGPTTSHIVKWLKAHDVPATFFLIGRAVDADPAMVRAELRDGFAIGDHTQTHPRLQ